MITGLVIYNGDNGRLIEEYSREFGYPEHMMKSGEAWADRFPMDIVMVMEE